MKDLIKAQMKNSEVQTIRQLLHRVHFLIARYFDAMEKDIHSNSYGVKTREQDARVFNSLAQTLMRLHALDSLIKPLEGDKSDEAIQKPLSKDSLKSLGQKRLKTFLSSLSRREAQWLLDYWALWGARRPASAEGRGLDSVAYSRRARCG